MADETHMKNTIGFLLWNTCSDVKEDNDGLIVKTVDGSEFEIRVIKKVNQHDNGTTRNRRNV